MKIIDHSTDDHGRPIILWSRRGGHRRRLTGTSNGHLWSVEVPFRARTVREALDWLHAKGEATNVRRQGE
jgi:hypothetical protein